MKRKFRIRLLPEGLYAAEVFQGLLGIGYWTSIYSNGGHGYTWPKYYSNEKEAQKDIEAYCNSIKKIKELKEKAKNTPVKEYTCKDFIKD